MGISRLILVAAPTIRLLAVRRDYVLWRWSVTLGNIESPNTIREYRAPSEEIEARMDVATTAAFDVVVVANKLEVVAPYSKFSYLVRALELGWHSKRQSPVKPRGVEVVGERIDRRDLRGEITAGICHVCPFDCNGSLCSSNLLVVVRVRARSKKSYTDD